MNTVFKIGILAIASTAIVSGKSLWLSKNNNEAGVMSDHKAVGVGDIVFIQIDESTSVSTSLNKGVSSNSSINKSISEFLTIGSASGALKHNGQLPSVVGSANQSLSGSGNTAIEKTIATKVAVLVTDRFPNGNLLVEGVKETFSSGERQYIILKGIVRRQDVSASNVVQSSMIANAQIEFLDEGALADSQKRSLIMNILDKVNIW